MRSIQFVSHRFNRGVSLPEMVTAVVILGILAAVAVPDFSGFTDDAKKSKASAIFGSLKASYAVQSSIKKGGNVSVTDIVTGQDPACSGTGSTRTCGNAVVVFSGTVTAVTATANWTCTVSDVTGTPACP